MLTLPGQKLFIVFQLLIKIFVTASFFAIICHFRFSGGCRARLRTSFASYRRMLSLLLNVMIDILITNVFRIKNPLVSLLKLAGLTLVLQDPTTLLSQRLLLLLAKLPRFLLSMRVKEGLHLVYMVMQLQLLRTHVRMSKFELCEPIIGVSLFRLDVTLPFWERLIVLPATVIYFWRFVQLWVLIINGVLRLTGT